MENFAFALAALFISVIALVLTVWQIRVARGANHLPVVLDAFKASRSPEWFEAQEYILNKLPGEHAAGCAWRDLPQQARDQVNTIGLFYDDIGKLVAHHVIRQDLVIGSYGDPIVYLWDALAPYVYAERAYIPGFWVYFEDLAARTASRPPRAVYAKLRLRPRPPRQELDAIQLGTGSTQARLRRITAISGCHGVHTLPGPQHTVRQMCRLRQRPCQSADTVVTVSLSAVVDLRESDTRFASAIEGWRNG